MKKILLAATLLLFPFNSFAESGEINSASSGSSATADALTSDPADCSANQYAHAISATGDLTCSTLSDADVPNALTINGGTIDNSVIGGTTPAAGTFNNVLVKNGSSTIISLTNTDPDVFSGDLNQITMSGNGGGTITGSADAYRLLRMDANLTTGTQSNIFRAIHAQVKGTGSSVSSGAAGIGLRGAHFAAIWDSTGTASNVYGIQTNAVSLDGGSSVAAGAVTNVVANNATFGYSSGATGTGSIVTGYGYYVNTPQNTSAGRTIATAHGLYIENQVATGVTSANAITTGTGKVNFGDNVYFTAGAVMDAGSYTIGRTSDSPNRLYIGVPTSRELEIAVNDVTEYLFSATDLDLNSNTLSNVGATGTDFTNQGALVIGPAASTTGVSALTVNQAAHTAITANQPSINVASASETINSGSTVASASAVDISPVTYVGVAGGGTETVTDAATLRIVGPAVQGADVTVTNALSFLVDSGNARFDGFIQSNPQTVTGADDGAGTPALVTITPSSNIIQITCNDPNNCNITMSETGQRNGVSIKLVNMSANACVFADTGGVSELATGFTAGQYDSISMTYQADRWVEDSRSNN